MRRLLAWIICACLCAPMAVAHAEEEALFAWTLQLGSSGLTEAAAIVPILDGGVYVAGSTDCEDNVFGEPWGGWDGFVTRIEDDGSVAWSRRLGGSGEDYLTTLLELPEDGCLVLGTTTSEDGDVRSQRGGTDAWLVRLSAEGETVWSKCLGGSSDDELLSMQLTEDGFIFALGRTMSRNGDLNSNYGGWDAWATLLNPEDGRPIWTYRYGFAGDDKFTAAYPTHEGWMLLGEVAEETAADEEGNATFTLRPIAQLLTLEGEAAWDPPRTLGDTGNNRLFAVTETDTGWLLAGETNSRSALMPTPYGGVDLWVLHMRSTGSVAWQRTYGGSKDETLKSMHAVPAGGYLLLASSYSSDGQLVGAHGEADAWVVRLTASGMTEWQQPIGGSLDSDVAGILYREDGGFTIFGTTASQDGDIGRHLNVRTGFVATLASNGNLTSLKLTNENDECALIEVTARDGVAYVLGSIRGVNTEGHIRSLWLARLTEEGFEEL